MYQMRRRGSKRISSPRADNQKPGNTQKDTEVRACRSRGVPAELKEYTPIVEDGLHLATSSPGDRQKPAGHARQRAGVPVEWIDNRVTSKHLWSSKCILSSAPTNRLSSRWRRCTPRASASPRAAPGKHGWPSGWRRAHLGQRTLWITHTMDLLKQSIGPGNQLFGLGGEGDRA